MTWIQHQGNGHVPGQECPICDGYGGGSPALGTKEAT